MSNHIAVHKKSLTIPENQLDFLKQLEEVGSITQASALVGVTASQVAVIKKKDKRFADAIEIAKAKGLANLRSIIKDRAINGVVEPVFYRDNQIGEKTVYDNNLLWKYAEAIERDAFNKKETTGNVSITQNVNVDSGATLDKLSNFLKIDLNKRMVEMEGEDDDYSQGDADYEDIIEGECDDKGSE